jgi:hypothetical protein
LKASTECPAQWPELDSHHGTLRLNFSLTGARNNLKELRERERERERETQVTQRG